MLGILFLSLQLNIYENGEWQIFSLFTHSFEPRKHYNLRTVHFDECVAYFDTNTQIAWIKSAINFLTFYLSRVLSPFLLPHQLITFPSLIQHPNGLCVHCTVYIINANQIRVHVSKYSLKWNETTLTLVCHWNSPPRNNRSH